MSKLKEMTDAHVAVYALDASEVARILRDGKPLDSDQLEAMERAEVYSLARSHRLTEPDDPHVIPMPPAVAERIFPGHILAPNFICICIGVRWCLEYNSLGQLVYLLKCEFICIPLFALATAAID
jgi:hypothetical protein